MDGEPEHTGGLYSEQIGRFDARVLDFHTEAPQEGLDADSVLEMAQPVVPGILKPGYPFALGASILLPQAG